MKKNILKELQKVEIFVIISYKKYLSPIPRLIFGGGCRYTPTCSDYALEALSKYGPFKGLYLSLIRFLRCNPLSGHPRHYPLK